MPLITITVEKKRLKQWRRYGRDYEGLNKVLEVAVLTAVNEVKIPFTAEDVETLVFYPADGLNNPTATFTITFSYGPGRLITSRNQARVAVAIQKQVAWAVDEFKRQHPNFPLGSFGVCVQAIPGQYSFHM